MNTIRRPNLEKAQTSRIWACSALLFVTILAPMSKAWATIETPRPIQILECRQSIEGIALFEDYSNQYGKIKLLNRSKSQLQLPELNFFSGDTEIRPAALWITSRDRLFRLHQIQNAAHLQEFQLPKVEVGTPIRVGFAGTTLLLNRSPKGILWIEQVETRGTKPDFVLAVNGSTEWDEQHDREQLVPIQRFAVEIERHLSGLKIYEPDLELAKYLGASHFERLLKNRLDALKTCQTVLSPKVLKSLENQFTRLLDPTSMGLQPTPN